MTFGGYSVFMANPGQLWVLWSEKLINNNMFKLLLRATLGKLLALRNEAGKGDRGFHGSRMVLYWAYWAMVG